MAGGGIYDHVAGGFHRYSTDEQWLVPHFEKMLYDNALLAVAYLEAWQATGNADFQRVVYEILAYTGRDMTSPEGAFYSATDADSKNSSGHMEEGWYFTWTPEELETILGKERADIVEKYYLTNLVIILFSYQPFHPMKLIRNPYLYNTLSIFYLHHNENTEQDCILVFPFLIDFVMFLLHRR